MLKSLYVKNLALIEETKVDFKKGFNIMTGETGAGKSLIIGSVNLALGARFESSMLRHGADYGIIELEFTSLSEDVINYLKEENLPIEEDGSILISRRLTDGKTLCRINGESVSAKQVKELASYLIDMHGQHEHQSLLNKKKHLEILDSYGGEETASLLEEVKTDYKEYRDILKTIEEESKDDISLQKELSLAEFEVSEIEKASLRPGEDEELEKRYRLMVNSQKIAAGIYEALTCMTSDSETDAASFIGKAVRCIRSIASLDDKISEFDEEVSQIESMISDVSRELNSYLSDMNFDEKEFAETEERLNILNHLKDKYGKTLEDVFKYAEDRLNYIDRASDYDAYMKKLYDKRDKALSSLQASALKLSKLRRKNALLLTEKIKTAMEDLNFNYVDFEISVKETEDYSSNGNNDVEFLLSVNPGEVAKPLQNVASGGELSRTMLAIKTVLAGKDAIDTLVFDEIDSGISGRTAWKVAKSLAKLSKSHQVICITHLPQIAAMADEHFVIEKSSSNDSTITDIRSISGEDTISELARLLGSDILNEAALENARQLKKEANENK